VLVALAVLVGGGYFGGGWIGGQVRDLFSGAEDYPGPGTGKVSFDIKRGETVADMGRNLKKQGVVASVEAFVDAAKKDPDSQRIPAGSFKLKKKMKASDVVAILVDPAQRIGSAITVREGLRVTDVIDILAKRTDYSKRDFQKVLDTPGKLGLPDFAKGNPEGYLFPATYDFCSDATPTSMLGDMVRRWRQSADNLGLKAGAAKLGYSEQEIMTVASIVQMEGRGKDMPKVARVIYNRLEVPGAPGDGKLQIDATVNFALGQTHLARVTQEQINSVAESPYNTYTQKGLPPGPIAAPGDDAIRAALHPASGDWTYYVTVNLSTGKTKFTNSETERAEYVAELNKYCDKSDLC
jgi:UPF0755 protein